MPIYITLDQNELQSRPLPGNFSAHKVQHSYCTTHEARILHVVDLICTQTRTAALVMGAAEQLRKSGRS